MLVMKRATVGILTGAKFRFENETFRKPWIFFQKDYYKNSNCDNFLFTFQKFVFSLETSIQF